MFIADPGPIKTPSKSRAVAVYLKLKGGGLQNFYVWVIFVYSRMSMYFKVEMDQRGLSIVQVVGYDFCEAFKLFCGIDLSPTKAG